MVLMRQVLPSDNECAVVSQRLIEASLRGETETVIDCLGNSLVDVNHIGTVTLRVKCTETVLHEEAQDEVKIEYEEFRTDVTALFAAAHAGHIDITRRLVSAGADVNQKLFRGYATTAAGREGHYQLLGLLLKAGASQPACEDALLEACFYGQAKAAELLIRSEMARPDVSAHALVYASSRGFVDIVAILIKNGVDINSWDRALLRSAKPALHTNVDCTPLVAAIVSRQAAVVKYLLEVGAKTDCRVNLGAWSWDTVSGEELRVGASLAEPYNEAWCAVEYYEARGEILKVLVDCISPDSEHQGRTLICHAVLCCNSGAVHVLLDAGANAEFCVRTKNGLKFRPLHMAARMGCLSIVKLFIAHGCDLNARTEKGETALMLCAKNNHQECFKELLIAGADIGLVNLAGQNAVSIAEEIGFERSVHQVLWETMKEGKKIKSSDLQVFSSLHFVARFGDAVVLRKLLEHSDINLNEQDRYGYSATMIAAKEGHIEVFKVLIFAGADVKLKNKKGETALVLFQVHGNKDHFEKVLLDAVLANLLREDEFKALHYAARRGNVEALVQLLNKGCAVNALDDDDYTPLMLAAREGHADACKILLLRGSDCCLENPSGETALALARRNNLSKVAEGVILDHLARKFVLAGEQLFKHTRQGKGAPHMKMVRMLKSGLLTWGKSRRRNVVCKEAGMGPSVTFRKNRCNGDADKPVIFRIVTIKGREIHFEAGSPENVELWVRGINLIAKETITLNGNAAGN